MYEVNNENSKLLNWVCSIDLALMCLCLCSLSLHLIFVILFGHCYFYIFSKTQIVPCALEYFHDSQQKLQAFSLFVFFLILASKDKTLKVFDINCPACPLFLFKRGEVFWIIVSKMYKILYIVKLLLKHSEVNAQYLWRFYLR